MVWQCLSLLFALLKCRSQLLVPVVLPFPLIDSFVFSSPLFSYLLVTRVVLSVIVSEQQMLEEDKRATTNVQNGLVFLFLFS